MKAAFLAVAVMLAASPFFGGYNRVMVKNYPKQTGAEVRTAEDGPSDRHRGGRGRADIAPGDGGAVRGGRSGADAALDAAQEVTPKIPEGGFSDGGRGRAGNHSREEDFGGYGWITIRHEPERLERIYEGKLLAETASVPVPERHWWSVSPPPPTGDRSEGAAALTLLAAGGILLLIRYRRD